MPKLLYYEVDPILLVLVTIDDDVVDLPLLRRLIDDVHLCRVRQMSRPGGAIRGKCVLIERTCLSGARDRRLR